MMRMGMSYTIFATGALAKFLDLRERGGSRDELTRLSREAMRELVVAKGARSPGVVDLDRERLKREWNSAPE